MIFIFSNQAGFCAEGAETGTKFSDINLTEKVFYFPNPVCRDLFYGTWGVFTVGPSVAFLKGQKELMI